jgi:hypothetical protein
MPPPHLTSVRLAGDMARGLGAGIRRAVGCMGGASTQAARSWLALAARPPARRRCAVRVSTLHRRCDVGGAGQIAGKRGMIGCFAVGLLARVGWRP